MYIYICYQAATGTYLGLHHTVLGGARDTSLLPSPTANSRSQWALPDLNRELQISVGTAGLQPDARENVRYNARKYVRIDAR